jgi:hypothetical protein
VLLVDGKPVTGLLDDRNAGVPLSFFLRQPVLPAPDDEFADEGAGRGRRVLLTCCECGSDTCGGSRGSLTVEDKRVAIDWITSNRGATDHEGLRWEFDRQQFADVLSRIAALPAPALPWTRPERQSPVRSIILIG